MIRNQVSTASARKLYTFCSTSLSKRAKIFSGINLAVGIVLEILAVTAFLGLIPGINTLGATGFLVGGLLCIALFIASAIRRQDRRPPALDKKNIEKPPIQISTTTKFPAPLLRHIVSFDKSLIPICSQVSRGFYHALKEKSERMQAWEGAKRAANQAPMRCLRSIGEAMAKVGEFDDALSLAEQLKDGTSLKVETALQMAKSGKFEEAKEILESNQADKRGWCRYAEILALAYHFDAADQTLLLHGNSEENRLRVKLAKAKAFLALGNMEEAHKLYGSSCERIEIIKKLLEENNIEKAKKLTNISSAGRFKQNALCKIVKAELEANLFDDAKLTLDSILPPDRHSPYYYRTEPKLLAHYHYASALIKAGRENEIQESLEAIQILADVTDDKSYLYYKALLLYEKAVKTQSNFDEALDFIIKYREDSLGMEDVTKKIAKALARQGEFEKAWNAIEKGCWPHSGIKIEARMAIAWIQGGIQQALRWANLYADDPELQVLAFIYIAAKAYK